MSAPNKNMQFQSILLFFTWLLCAFPQFRTQDVPEKTSKNFKKFNLAYTISQVAFWIALSFIGIYFKTVMVCKEMFPIAVMGYIEQCTLAGFAITIVMKLGVMHKKDIQELFQVLDQIDFILDFKLAGRAWKTYLNLTIVCLIQTIHGVYYFAFQSGSSALTRKAFCISYSARMLKMIQISLVMLTIKVLCYQIYQRFQKLNILLKKFNPLEEPKLFDDKYHKYFMFKELKKIHSMLCDQVDMVNKVFGLLLVWFMVVVVIGISYYILLMFGLVILDKAVKRFDIGQLLTACLSGILYISLEIITLAWVGNLVATETTNTHKICYSLLNCVPSSNEGSSEQLFRKELKSLAIHSGFRQPYVSANSIFKLDFGILPAIVASLSSYIILAQQFLQEYRARLDLEQIK